MSNKYLIPIFKPKLPPLKHVAKYLETIDNTSIYSNWGPLVKKLEQRYAEFLDTSPENIVAVCNATLALKGLIEVLNLKKWVIPNFTFPATALALSNSNKEILVADILEHDWQLEVNNKLSFLDLGFIPVMPFGAPVNFDKFDELKYLIIDAAASLGSGKLETSRMKPDWSVVYSLHATKVLGAGEGGIVVFGSNTIAKEFRKWINFGFDQNRISSGFGTNAKMPEISAAYALSSLDWYSEESQEWIELQDKINEGVKGSRFENCTNFYDGFNPYWIIRCKDKQDRRAIATSLGDKCIETRLWWPNLVTDYMDGKKLFHDKESVSRRISDSILGLPKHRFLKPNEIDYMLGLLLRLE